MCENMRLPSVTRLAVTKLAFTCMAFAASPSHAADVVGCVQSTGSRAVCHDSTILHSSIDVLSNSFVESLMLVLIC
jgi:hypothetical protein